MLPPNDSRWTEFTAKLYAGLVTSLKQFEERERELGGPLSLPTSFDDFRVMATQTVPIRAQGSVAGFEEAACLGIGFENGQRSVVLFSSMRRSADADWKTVQSSIGPLDDDDADSRNSVPFFLASLLGFHRVVVALIANSEHVGRLRLTLSDGSQHETSVKNGSALLLVPFDLSMQSSENGTLEVIDQGGTLISKEAIRVLTRGDKLAR